MPKGNCPEGVDPENRIVCRLPFGEGNCCFVSGGKEARVESVLVPGSAKLAKDTVLHLTFALPLAIRLFS